MILNWYKYMHMYTVFKPTVRCAYELRFDTTAFNQFPACTWCKYSVFLITAPHQLGNSPKQNHEEDRRSEKSRKSRRRGGKTKSEKTEKYFEAKRSSAEGQTEADRGRGYRDGRGM